MCPTALSENMTLKFFRNVRKVSLLNAAQRGAQFKKKTCNFHAISTAIIVESGVFHSKE